MKILMVSSFLPYPLTSGGHIRLYNIIKHLSEKHKVTLVCERRDYQTENDILELKKICKEVITFDRKKQWTLSNIAKSGISSYPFLMVGHTNFLIQKKISEMLEKEKFDVIHVETFYVMQNLPITTIPVILAEHNIEYLVYERFKNHSLKPLQPLLYLDILKMKYWEKRMWQKATKLIAVSEPEKKLMIREAEIVPNGVDLTKFKFQISPLRHHTSPRLRVARGFEGQAKFKIQTGEKRVLFIGDFRWVQNRDAVEWIIREIWPDIKSKIKNEKSKIELKLWVVGREIPDSIKKINDEGIIFDENISNTAEIFEKAYVLISPTRVGGGTSFKILEAMASGVPVITTSLGIEGIDAVNEKEVLIGNTTGEIAQRIEELLGNADLYEKLAKNARRLIEEKYGWEKITKKLESIYYSVVKN